MIDFVFLFSYCSSFVQHDIQVGICINNDINYLKPHFPVGMAFKAFVESRILAKKYLDLTSYTLAKVTEAVLGKHLPKTVDHKYWDDRPLGNTHVRYAVADAAASFEIHLALLALPPRENNTHGQWQVRSFRYSF
jgi:ribonuclease D